MKINKLVISCTLAILFLLTACDNNTYYEENNYYPEDNGGPGVGSCADYVSLDLGNESVSWKVTNNSDYTIIVLWVSEEGIVEDDPLTLGAGQNSADDYPYELISYPGQSYCVFDYDTDQFVRGFTLGTSNNVFVIENADFP